MENFTASALSGVPSWNLMPFRSLNVYLRPSFEIVHDSASPGTIWVLSSAKATSVSTMRRETRLRVEIRHLGRIEIDRLGDEPDDERAGRLGRHGDRCRARSRGARPM